MKTDPALGKKVKQKLIELGIETPMAGNVQAAAQETIAFHFDKIMRALGLNMEDDSLQDSPNRVSKMYVKEIMSGLNYDNFPKCTLFENKMQYSQMIKTAQIPILSVCEHHFATIDGHAEIAYIPKNVVVGLSKLNRVAKFFARRPQVQERLTNQIHEALKLILETDDVAVRIKATHFCMKARGAEDESLTTTTALSGSFLESESVKMEFFKS